MYLGRFGPHVVVPRPALVHDARPAGRIARRDDHHGITVSDRRAWRCRRNFDLDLESIRLHELGVSRVGGTSQDGVQHLVANDVAIANGALLHDDPVMQRLPIAVDGVAVDLDRVRSIRHSIPGDRTEIA